MISFQTVVKKDGGEAIKREQGRPNKYLRIIILAILFSSYTGTSNGEEAYLDVKVTIPARIQEPVKDVSNSISVITPDRIEEEDPIVPTESLRDTPGLDTKEAGTIGEQMFVRLRGTESFHTLVLIDGIKVNSPFIGSFDFGDLLMDGVEQIEIVRGSQSALYGSEAIGGVIDLRTKSGKTAREFSLKGEAGNNSTFRENFQMRGRADKGYYSLSASRIDTGGDLERDDFQGMAFLGEAGYNPTIDSDLRFTTLYTKSRKDLGTDFLEFQIPVQVVLDENHHVERDLILSSVSFSVNPFKWWQVKIIGSVFDSGLINENPEDPGAATPNEFFEDTDNRRLSGEIQTNIVLSDAEAYDVITTGFYLEKEEVESELSGTLIDILLGPDSNFFVQSKRNSWAYYLQNLFKIKDHFTLQTGARLDQYSDFGSAINPKISSSYIVGQTDTKIRGGLGRGFRTPSILELDFPVFGNPDLDPERSTSYEFGIDQWFFSKTLSLSATAFYIFIEDLIQPDLTVLKFINIGEAVSKGIELEASVKPFDSLKLSGNYTYLKTEDRITGEELPFRPRNKWNLSLLYLPTPALILNIDLNVVSSQFINVDFISLDGDLISGRSPGYTRVDLAASYDLFKKIGIFKDFQFFFKVNNLLDAEIMEVPGFPAAGLSFLAGIKVYL